MRRCACATAWKCVSLQQSAQERVKVMQNPVRYFDSPKPKLARRAIYAIGSAILGVIVFTAMTAKAHAWSGCGAGVHGSFLVGEADFGAPINISSNGQMASASVNCDWRINTIVLGGEVSYGFLFGDLEKLGAERDLAVTGRAGVLLSPAALFYGHVGWTQLDTAAGNMDGIRMGIGAELKIADSPLYLDIRHSYTRYDDDLFPPTVDVSSHMLTIGLKFKFGPKYQPSLFDEPASKPCDKKMANCK